MARRADYEPIGEQGAFAFPDSEVYGALYQGGADAENPFGHENAVRITRRARLGSSSATESDPSRKRFLWWVLGPAITLLLVMAVSVGVVYQNNAGAVSRDLDTPTLGSARQPAPAGALTATTVDDVKAALGNIINAPEPAADDDSSATVEPAVDDDAADADADTDADTPPGQKVNATAVLSCLEDKCEPLVTQLGKTWKELANINLLRCLANAAFNKTAASVCFKAAGPSTLRDDLVACAGCNKCIKLKAQASVDRACAKYEAWAEKKRAEAEAADAAAAAAADDADADDATTTTTEAVKTGGGGGVLLEAPGDAEGSLAAGLPEELRSKLCSQHWCP